MSLETRVEDLITQQGTDYKLLRDTIIGALSALATADKTSIVDAINELQSEITAGGGPPDDASTTVKGIIEIATLAEHATGTDAVRAATPQGVKQEVDALKTLLLGGATSAYDTLQELKALIDAGDADDQADIGTLLTAIGTKQDSDAALTSLAGLTLAANKMIYTTGVDTFATADITAAGRALLAGADAAAQRVSLSVYSQAEIGDPDTDFAAIWTAAIA